MLFYAIPLNAKLSLWYNKQIVIIYLLAGKLLDLFTEDLSLNLVIANQVYINDCQFQSTAARRVS